MKPHETEVGMHVVRPNGARAVVVGDSYFSKHASVYVTPVFYGAGVGVRNWFTINMEPDPDPPTDYWAPYVAWRLVQ